MKSDKLVVLVAIDGSSNVKYLSELRDLASKYDAFRFAYVDLKGQVHFEQVIFLVALVNFLFQFVQRRFGLFEYPGFVVINMTANWYSISSRIFSFEGISAPLWTVLTLFPVLWTQFAPITIS